MIGADYGTVAAGALMAATAAAVYKLLGLAVPRIGRSVMEEQVDKGVTKALAPLTADIRRLDTQIATLDGKVSAHLIEEAKDVRGIHQEMRRRNDAHDTEHDRLWDKIGAVETEMRRDYRRRE